MKTHRIIQWSDWAWRSRQVIDTEEVLKAYFGLYCSMNQQLLLIAGAFMAESCI